MNNKIVIRCTVHPFWGLYKDIQKKETSSLPIAVPLAEGKK